MQQGWKCPNCSNVYAPNIPFCLYCWFNEKNAQNPLTPITAISTYTQTTNSESVPIQTIQKQLELNTNITKIDLEKEEGKEEKKEGEEEKDDQKQLIEKNNIKLPFLNKQPDYPLPRKWPDTKIFLSSIAHSKERAINRSFKIPYILDSVMDFPIKPSSLVYKYFNWVKTNSSDFLLDSGAFTLMRNKHKRYNLNDLISKYCFYINEFDIQNFFELDLDELMPINEVEELRKKIYLETHKMPILVWHKERNKEYWTRMCKENEFIAIGGMAHRNSQKIAIDIDFYRDLVDEAHTYNTKVHGLGFTPVEMLNAHTIFFDTVDSTSWNGGRYGVSFAIKNNQLKKIPLRNNFFPSDSAEEDLKIWAKFSIDYYGTERI